MILINQLTAEMGAQLSLIKDAATRLELGLNPEIEMKILLSQVEKLDKHTSKVIDAVNKLIDIHEKEETNQ